VNENQPLSLAKAQKAIGFEGDRKGRKLFRELRAREKVLKVTIMVPREGDNRERGGCTVTIAAIRKHAPDLAPTRTNVLLNEARRYLEEVNIRIDERVAEQCERQYQRRVVPELTRIRKEQEATAEVVSELSFTVSRLATSTR
jgi:hypothetical protein